MDVRMMRRCGIWGIDEELEIVEECEQLDDVLLIFKRQINDYLVLLNPLGNKRCFDHRRQDGLVEMMPMQADAQINRREIFQYGFETGS